MANERSPTQYKGVRAIAPPDLTLAKRAPTSDDKAYIKGQLWLDTVASAAYQWSGTAWITLGSGTTGSINSITGDTGGAETPLAGNFNLLGTANQIIVTGTSNTETFHLSSTLVAPGSITSTTTIASGTTMTAGTGITSTLGNIVATAGNISATVGSLAAGTTVTAGTSITATLGDITATNGNFVGTAVGKGILLNSAQASGVAASPVVVNGRSGRATFTSVSIAAAADLTLTLTNSAITASTTEVMLSMSGATTGSALSIKSKTASAGSLAIVVTNGTGATTTTADIQIDFLVLNT